jgi:hypothetical protein
MEKWKKMLRGQIVPHSTICPTMSRFGTPPLNFFKGSFFGKNYSSLYNLLTIGKVAVETIVFGLYHTKLCDVIHGQPLVISFLKMFYFLALFLNVTARSSERCFHCVILCQPPSDPPTRQLPSLVRYYIDDNNSFCIC